ncbi:MAG: MFS transporter [Parvibaculum sp.]|uniref:MFS transporter n=1 Tax=Parvibaculum sp. TaxID=2024848 RepID=UPI003C76AA18
MKVGDAVIHSDGLPIPRRYRAMLTIGLGVTMAVLDGAVANIALPTIARELNATAAQSVWVVNAYQLVIVVSLLPLSSLGEIIGYSRIYRVGLAIFGVASLACALSNSLETLVAARVLQGIGAACIMSVNSALVRFIYPRAQLGRGIGIIAFVVALAAAAGPTVASGILSIAPWQWIFAINVPLSLISIAVAGSLPLTVRALHRFDWLSAALNAAAFGFFILGVDHLGHGLDHLGRVAIEFAIAIACGFWLVRRQLSRPAPLLPVDLLRIPIFALSIMTSICSFGAQMLAYVTLPFYLQNVLHRSAVETGLLMTPWPIALVFVAPMAGRLADRYPAGLLGGIGMAIFAVGLGALAWLPADPSSLDICWRMLVCGVGFGLFQSPNNRTMLSSAPIERAGGASGMLGTARLTGQTLGTAVVALIFNLATSNGSRIALMTATSLALVAMILSSLRLTDAGSSAQNGWK